jgi:hypothetical protein
MRTFYTVTCAAFAVAFTACSNGSTPVLPGADSNIRASSAEARTATVSVKLQWKATSQAKRSSRDRPHFISPSAQSIEIDVTTEERSSKPVMKVVNRPKTASSSTVTFSVPVGSDAFAFSVFDRHNANGNVIGGSNAIKTIVAGRTNVVNATLDGYVAEADLTPTSGAAFFQPNTVSGGYTLLGETPIQATLTFKDADGNVILFPKQNAPFVSIASNQPSLISAHLVAGEANAVAIQAIAPNPSFTPVELNLQVRSGPGGEQQYSQQYALQQGIVLYSAASGSPGSITVFDQQGKTYATAGGFPGLENPIAMAWNDQDGELFVADAGRHTILAYDANGNALKNWAAPSVPGITSVTYNHDTRKVYATAAQSAGAAQDAVLAFDLKGHAVATSGFAGAVGPTSIAYSNWATMNNPTGADQFWLISTSSNGSATLLCYSTTGGPATVTVNGQQVSSELLTGSGFIPSALTAYPPNWSGAVGGTGASGPLIAGTYNGAGSLFIGAPPPTGAGLNQPRMAVKNPLFAWFPGLNVTNQPVQFYVVNASGGLDVIGATGSDVANTFQQITSVSFPPPAGATGFSSLVVTF